MRSSHHRPEIEICLERHELGLPEEPEVARRIISVIAKDFGRSREIVGLVTGCSPVAYTYCELFKELRRDLLCGGTS